MSESVSDLMPHRPSKFTLIFTSIILSLASIVPIIAGTKLIRPLDDVYITLSYARSIVEDHSFRLHESSEPSLGTTTPLNTLLIAALSKVIPSADLPSISIWLSVVAWIATGWLWGLRGQILGLGWFERMSIAVLLLFDVPLVPLLGFEFKLFVLLLSLSLMLYTSKHDLWTGLCIGLLFLTRGEGILLLAAFGLNEVFLVPANHRLLAYRPAVERLLKMTAGFGVVFLAWAIFALSTVGVVLPNTFQAKIAQVVYLDTHANFASGILPSLADWSPIGKIETGIGDISLWIVVAALGLVYAFLYRRRLLLLFYWMVIFILGYSVLSVPNYAWYIAPIQFIVTVFAGLCIGSLPNLFRWASKEAKIPRLQPVGVVLAVICLVVVTYNGYEHSIPKERLDGTKHADYKWLSEWLNANTDPDSTIAYYEVGYLNWYTDREIIDLLGLTNPELFEPIRESHDFSGPFLAANPDWWINSYQYLDYSITSMASLWETYFPNAYYEGEHTTYVFFHRYDPALTPDPNDYVFDIPKMFSFGFIDHYVWGNGMWDGQASNDPSLMQTAMNICAGMYPELIVEMAVSFDVGPGDRTLQVFFAAPGDDITEERSVRVEQPYDSEMHLYEINLKELAPEWDGIIDTLRIDPVGAATHPDNSIKIRSMWLKYDPSGQPCE